MKKLIAIIASALTLGAFAADQRNVPFAVDTTDYEPGTEIDILVDGEYDGTVEATGGIIYYQANDYVIGQQVAFAPKMAGEPTPVAVWNAADFSSTQNDWSIDINGNTLDDNGFCTIGTKPIKIVNKTITGDTKTAFYYTVVMDVADVPMTETTGALVTFGRYPANSTYAGYANTDLIGAMLENGTPYGIWNGDKRTGGTTAAFPEGEVTRITVLYKSGGQSPDNGVWAFVNGNNKVFTADSGLRASMQVNQINIGGRSDNNTMALAGMKVKSIAIYAGASYAGDATMTTVEIPQGDLRVFTSIPTAEQISEFLTEDWTGTVWLKGFRWNNWDFGSLGNANSRVRLTGIIGYGPQVALKECATTVDLVDEGTTVALKQDNGFSTSGSDVCTYKFAKIIGTGTLQTAPARATPQIRIVDASEFNGSLNVSVMRVAIGEGSEPTVGGKVTIEEGATLAIATGKSVNAVAGAGTLVLPNFTTSTNVRDSLKNADWTGTVEVSKHVLTAQTQINLADYGHVGSKIVIKGMTGINDNAGRYLPSNCHITADVQIDNTVEFNQGSSGANYYFDGTVSGSGDLKFINWRANDGFNAGYHIAKLQNYTGTLTTSRATTIDVLDLAEAPASDTKVVKMTNASDATIRVLKVTINGEDAPSTASIEVKTDGLYYVVEEPTPTYPEAMEGGSAEQQAAYVAWATAAGVTDPTTAGATEAFVLNLTATKIEAAGSVEQAVKDELDTLLESIEADDLLALMQAIVAGESDGVIDMSSVYPNATIKLVTTSLGEGVKTDAKLFKLSVSFKVAN